ncbi:hypothetical protein [Streptomyces profundus]|uniref:hypothetical protein n=1 Tax=Streptomyces profundus TaxID=2867410 RepID=UPI001D167C33|nr:hypothetical protein [Streptomyces sp. MA3_2.13]UED86587.1 hypothetical protein K4G22_22310 [Streptomyces sp. MA3_2.13]
MKDQQIIAHFDGSSEVKVVTQTRVRPVLAIAHEFGYVMTSCRFRTTGVASFTFVRDDGELARRRAAWARYHYDINGAWWATAAPRPTDQVSPIAAGEARLGLFTYKKWPVQRYLRRLAAFTAVAALAGIWFLSTDAVEYAVLCLLAALGAGATMIWGPGHRARKEVEYRQTLEAFDRQRVFWSYDDGGGGG